MTEQAKVTIASRLVAAMGEIDAVTKEGKNQAQNYNYVRAADVANEVRKVLVKHGISFGFDVVEEERWSNDRFSREGVIVGVMNYVRIVADVIFEDAVTGELRTRKARGWGQDVGEKAIYKAMTGALKYALRMNFIIPDESDPENEETRTTPEQSEQRKAPVQVKPNPPIPAPRSQTVSGSGAAATSSTVEEGNFTLAGDLLECVVKGVTDKTTKGNKPYVAVTVNGRVEGFNWASNWHQSLTPALKSAIGKPTILKISRKMSEDGKSIQFLNVEDVIHIDGTDYENGQPKKTEVTNADIPF